MYQLFVWLVVISFWRDIESCVRELCLRYVVSKYCSHFRCYLYLLQCGYVVFPCCLVICGFVSTLRCRHVVDVGWSHEQQLLQ